jgi:hypothetical protein
MKLKLKNIKKASFGKSRSKSPNRSTILKSEKKGILKNSRSAKNL